MEEVMNSQEIFDANPAKMKLLDSLVCRVQCDYKWNETRSRPQLFVMIDDKTTQKDVDDSWQYILTMREMLQNFQGPYWHGGQFMWKGLAYHMHTPEGGSQKPKQIAHQLNNMIDFWAEEAKVNGEVYQYPEGYPFDNVYVEQMIKNWRKKLDRYREDNG